MDKETFETIAKAIGHHFWKCETDEEAIFQGKDCAMEVMKALGKKHQ